MASRRGQHRAGLLGWSPALFSALAVLLIAAASSAQHVTHGFVAYFAASRLLLTGQIGPMIYDDEWFRGYVHALTGTGVLEVFGPNAPTMALMAVPVAAFDHTVARTLWLLASIAAFAAVVARMTAEHRRESRVMAAALTLLVMLQPAVFANLRTAQAYLFVCALVGAACVSLVRDRQRPAGFFLGLALTLKSSGAALLVLLAVRKRWLTVGTSLAMALAGAAVVTILSGVDVWRAYPSYVRSFVASPAASVTAYQTTTSLIRHLCVGDEVWNRAPAADCVGVATILPPVLLLAAVAFTIVRSREAPTRAWLAAGVALSELVLPIAAEPHAVLLAIPLMLLWPFREWGRWRTPFIAIVAALLFVPLESTASRFTDGWSAVLAYPRLYAAWLLWGAALFAMSSRPFAADVPPTVSTHDCTSPA